MDQKPFFLSSFAASQRTAYSEIPSQMAAHLRTGSPLKAGQIAGTRGLPINGLVLLPMSHHYPLQILDMYSN